MTTTGETVLTSEKGRVSSRESILASIRKSLAESVPFNAEHSQHVLDVSDTRLFEPRAFSLETLIENFKKNLESVGGHCSIVSTESEAAEAIEVAIQDLRATRIAVSNSPVVRSTIKYIAAAQIVENADSEFLFRSDIGITSAQWAIAETGTLVLESGDERHRLTSLVPPVHICILRADRIRQTLGEILGLINVDLSRTITFITGASRTSDIELTLAIGVHGPRELQVIIIVDQQS
jgi:L-lactate dehydrogenase complex protein LldG